MMNERDKLRQILDSLDEQRLRQLSAEIEATTPGSLHEIEGVRIPRDEALFLINQAIPRE